MKPREPTTLAAVIAAVLVPSCGEPMTQPPGPVHRIVVSPQRAAILPGTALQLTATLFGSAGDTVRGGTITWASFDTAVVTVSTGGVVLGMGLGTTTITARVDYDTAAAIIDVVAPIDSIVIIPSALILVGPFALRAILLDGARDTLTGRPIVWSSSDTNIATVSPAGVASGRRPGSVTVRGRSENVTGRASFTVRVPQYASIAAGYQHSCAIGSDSAAYCWGATGSTGFALGTGWRLASTAPVGVTGGLRFRTITAGSYSFNGYSCALTTDGVPYCWGDGFGFQLGNGGTASSTSPVPVAGGLVFTTLSSSAGHTCGLAVGGAAYCWGWGYGGALGDGDSTDNPVPTLVAGGRTFVAIDAGGGHTCALTAAGVAYCWGDNSYGQLGDSMPSPTAPARQTVPVPVAGGLTFRAITAGDRHTCGITVTGAAYCWGEDYRGQLGSSYPTTLCGSPLPFDARPCVTYPVLVDGGLTLDSITAGGRKTCALRAGGSAYCWGEGTVGQLGNGDTLSMAAPVAVAGGLTFAAIDAGSFHACGITTEAVAYCWGSGSFGALGTGNLVGSNPSPVRVAGQP